MNNFSAKATLVESQYYEKVNFDIYSKPTPSPNIKKKTPKVLTKLEQNASQVICINQTTQDITSLDYQRIVHNADYKADFIPLGSSFSDSVAFLTEEERFKLMRKFKEYIKANRVLEDLRINVALRFDFTVPDLFALLDQRARGKVSANDFFNFFKRNKISDEFFVGAQVLVEMFDSDKDGYLVYDDLRRMIQPFSYDYAQDLLKRSPKNFGRFMEYTMETREKVVGLVQAILDIRHNMRGIREQIFEKMKELFFMLDKNFKGRITLSDFKDVLEKEGLKVSSREVCGLIRTFDFEGKGAVSLRQFLDVFSIGEAERKAETA